MEFLIGRSLANNVTNLLLDPLVEAGRKEQNLDWLALLETGAGRRPRQRRPGPAGGLFPRFHGHDATSRRSATACAMNTECSSRPLRTAGRRSSPTIGCASPILGRSPRPDEKVEIKLNCSFEVRGGSAARDPGRPSTLIGIPYDRPVVGYGGRNHQHAAAVGRQRARLLRFSSVQSRRFRRCGRRNAGGGIPHAGALSGRFDQHGPGTALRAGIFSGGVFAGRSGAALPPPQHRLEHASRRRSRSSSTIRIRRCPFRN